MKRYVLFGYRRGRGERIGSYEDVQVGVNECILGGYLFENGGYEFVEIIDAETAMTIWSWKRRK